MRHDEGMQTDPWDEADESMQTTIFCGEMGP